MLVKTVGGGVVSINFLHPLRTHTAHSEALREGLTDWGLINPCGPWKKTVGAPLSWGSETLESWEFRTWTCVYFVRSALDGDVFNAVRRRSELSCFAVSDE